MADLTIASLRGGLNNTDPEIALQDDQCLAATNVEFISSMLGERRLGTTAISLPAAISSADKVLFLFRHLPSSDETAAELWILAIAGSTLTLVRKTTSWATKTISDTAATSGFSPYRWQAISIHGKLFLAYDSDVDRLHVVDSTGTLRRAGVAAPSAAPTGANTGVGTFSGTRYYRVRYAELSGSTVLRRSEPSAVLTFAPSGTGSGVIVTKPAALSPSEGETHWELEASTDNANFYRVATTVLATTTYTDTAASYTSNTLSEDTGDYTLLPSFRYLSHDDDRLLGAGSWENDAQASRVVWTPVFGASGVGNDERQETDTDPSKDLDTYKHGQITGISTPILGSIWVLKQRAVYKLTRTGIRTAAYDAEQYTDAVGGIHGSLISGVDETGQPCIYFLDYEQGPCRVGVGGLKRCGEDIRTTWSSLNINANAVVTSAVYYTAKKQAIWCIATGSSNTPDTAIVLHTDKSRTFADGVRKGWALWTGNRATALTMCLFSDNIDDNTTRSLKLVPFIGLSGNGLVHRCDTTNADNGTAYTATITTKPYWLRTVLNKFLVRRAALIAKATANAAVDVKVFRDFQLETTDTDSSVTFTATGSETNVIKDLDDLRGAELSVVQFQFTDVASPSAQWMINQLSVLESEGQKG